MILTANIGNTHIHLGLFIRGSLRKTWKIVSTPARSGDEYALLLGGMIGEGLPLQGAIVASDVPRLEWPVAAAIEEEFKTMPMIMDDRTPLGINNCYERPEEVGMDRLANAVGAYYLYGAPALILDFGTAVTLDYLAGPTVGDPLPSYMGGAILPGVEMSAEALAKGTAKLPRIELIEPRRVIGRTTDESMRAGLMRGYIGAIQSLVECAREEIGSAVPVYATGGDALDLRHNLPFLQEIEPNLTHYGLRQIYGINHDCPLPARR